MSKSAERDKLQAIDTIERYLEELRASRPSVQLAQGRSAKGVQTIALLLKAARAVFVREGHAGLTMRKVADEAGVVVGNVNYYFASKRELLEAMLREEMADHVEDHIHHFETHRESPMQILLNVVASYVANGRTTHQFFFQIWGFAGSDPQAKALIRDLYRPIGRFLYYMVRAVKPRLSDRRIRQIVLQISSLEEGVKLFMGMGPDDEVALKTAERDISELTRRIVEAG